MSFYGSSFSFDGISCEEFGLMLYDFYNTSQDESSFATGMNVQEDRIPMRAKSLFYGTQYQDPLQFTLIFGVKDSSEPIDRQDMELVASWLTDQKSYKELVIDQPDMVGVHYRCIMTGLKTLEFAGDKWAFSCDVHCDSPFAYLEESEFTYQVSGNSNIILKSRSSANIPYYPQIILELDGDGDFSMVNHSDGDYEFKLSAYPQVNDTIEINGETGVILPSSGINPYPYFNFRFPRLVRGDNLITLSGTGTITIRCEFPVNVGG